MPTQQQQRRQRRLERYKKVVDLFGQGYSQKAVSCELGIERKTIRRWLRGGQFPERKPAHRRPAKVSEFSEYLHNRWKEGCRNASRLYQEIRQKASMGKRSMVAGFVSDWRKPANRHHLRLRNASHLNTLPFSRPAPPTR
jgi:transposase